jgi:tungstate transport system substrate-binding protein
MRKITVLALCVILVSAFLIGCGTPVKPAASSNPSAQVSAEPSPALSESAPVSPKGVLMMATTTSTDNTGLLDYLAPLFLQDTGWELQWTAVGTGEALQLGMDGEVDIVLVHAKAKEEAFVKDGYGVERFQVMYNDFVVVGPTGGIIQKTDDIAAVFTQILNDKLIFVSRGDDSGTHTKELGIWKALELDFESNPNYISAGAGMSDTLIMADEKQGYCLSDRGTWLATKQNADNGISLEIICEGAKDLLNQYGVIAVNPVKYPEVNNEAANAFIEWICSDKVQALIGEYGVAEYGEPLFTPNAA